jgi:hypothetical protein
VADHSAALRRTLVVGAAAMRELQESLPLWVYVSTASITVTGSDRIGSVGRVEWRSSAAQPQRPTVRRSTGEPFQVVTSL